MISTYRVDTKREFVYHIVNEINGILLCMLFVNLQSSNTGCIIKSSILKPADFVSTSAIQLNELNIDLNMMSWHCFRISTRMNGFSWCSFRKPTYPISHGCSMNTGVCYKYTVKSFKIPCNLLRTKVIGFSNFEYFIISQITSFLLRLSLSLTACNITKNLLSFS